MEQTVHGLLYQVGCCVMKEWLEGQEPWLFFRTQPHIWVRAIIGACL